MVRRHGVTRYDMLLSLTARTCGTLILRNFPRD
jgi:hypothetical protein